MKCNLTSEQVDAITYAHMDIKAANEMFDSRKEPSDDTFSSPHYIEKEELFEATNQTTKDLEKAFPFLTEDVLDSRPWSNSEMSTVPLNRLYKNWLVHNIFAHPLSEAVYWITRPLGRKRAENISGWIHDVTVPVNYDIGRG